MIVAEFIALMLAKYNVKKVYGYPGAPMLPLIKAVEDNPALEWILMRTELSAALAASAQAKLTQHLSVCMTTSGPGATNIITGLLDADLDRAPVLAITGLIPTYKRGLSSFQDIDHCNLFSNFCGFNVVCEHPAQIPQLLQNAIGYIIKNNRAAHIAIPLDVQLMELNVADSSLNLHKAIALMAPPEAGIDLVTQTLNESHDIVIAVGARARGAGKYIEKLSEKLMAPIICAFSGKGIINENHPNYLGVLGLYGQPANKICFDIINQSKLILAFGVDDLMYFVTDKSLHQHRELIQCETDVTSITNTYIQKRILLGNLTEVAQALEKKITPQKSDLLMKAKNLSTISTETPKFDSEQYVHQQIFFTKINPFIDKPNTILTFDVGDNALWAMKYIKLTHYQSIAISNRFSVMGFFLPGAIAAKLTYPEHLVVAIGGDGGFQIVLNELNTAMQVGLNIYIVIIVNDVLQRIAAQQEGGARLLNPDYEQLVTSCGAAAVTIHHNNEIDDKLAFAFSIKDKPVCIIVKCSPSVFAEMATWT